MTLVYLVPFFLLYTISYLIWSLQLGYNHPLPFLGILMMLLMWVIFPIGLWFVLPSDLLAKEDFRRKMLVYMMYFLWCIIVGVLTEVLSYCFENFPSNLQFLVAFMIAACREFDYQMRSKLVDKMVGDQGEPATALLAITVSAHYTFFIAVRLADAEFTTMCCVLGIDFALHLIFTIQIINENRKVAVEGSNTEKKRKSSIIVMLVFSELMAGFTPLIYGICMAMAYYGPNSYLFTNIGCDFWGEKIDDIKAIFDTMFILLAVDTASFVITSFCIWKMTNLNIFQDFEEALGKYWLIMAIKLSYMIGLFFPGTDVNAGMDHGASFQWITEEGRLTLINKTSTLTGEEKSMLLANNSLI